MSHDIFKWNLVHLKLNSVGYQQTDPGQGQRLVQYIAISADFIFFALQLPQNYVSDIQPKRPGDWNAEPFF